MKNLHKQGLTLAAMVTVCLLVGQTTRARYAQRGGKTTVTNRKDTGVDIRGDNYNEKQTKAGSILNAAGHVRMVYEDTTLVTALASYNRTTAIANSPGKVQIDDAQNTIIGDTGVAYYNRHDARISGNVHITARPKPGNSNAPTGSARREFTEPAYITCDTVDYNWRGRVAHLTGHLILKYQDRTVTATEGWYYGKDERVELVGSVHYVRANGDKGDTPRATAILTEGAEEYRTEKFQGNFEVKDEDAPPAKPAGAGKTPARPGTVAPVATPTPLPPVKSIDTPPAPSTPPPAPPVVVPPVATP